MALPEFPVGGKPAAPFGSQTVTLDELKQNSAKKEAEAAALKQAEELEKKRLDAADAIDRQKQDAIADEKAALPRAILLDELKDPEVELRAKEAREAMGPYRAAEAARNETGDRYQKYIDRGRYTKAAEAARNENGDKYQKYIDLVPDGPPPAEKSAADSATEIANASPSKVGEVIEKLKEEEKKGGPNFFDIIEAAAAGWNGKVPQYVQKAIKQKEQDENIQLLAKQQEAQKAERLAAYEQERQLQREQAAADVDLFQRKLNADREIAGLAPLASTGAASGGLSLAGLSTFGGFK